MEWAAAEQTAARAPAGDGWNDYGAAADGADPSGDPAADRLVAHFERTIEALAADPMAALAFLANIENNNEERGGPSSRAASSEKGAGRPRRLPSRGQ